MEVNTLINKMEYRGLCVYVQLITFYKKNEKSHVNHFFYEKQR